MVSSVFIRDMQVRLFEGRKAPLDLPDLIRFHKDLLAGTSIQYDAELLQASCNNAYHEMSVEILEETGLYRMIPEVDVLLLAHNFPNSRPDISVVNYLMNRYQGQFISFAVNDLGFGAPFAALHMLQHYLNREGYTQGMLLVMDQTSFPYKIDELDSTAGPDTAAAIYLDRTTGSGPALLDVDMQYAENSIMDTAGLVFDRLVGAADVHRSRISLLIHPDLKELCQDSQWYRECQSENCYDPSHWSAAPFFSLQQMLGETDSGEYICLMHLEKTDSFIHGLMIRT